MDFHRIAKKTGFFRALVMVGLIPTLRPEWNRTGAEHDFALVDDTRLDETLSICVIIPKLVEHSTRTCVARGQVCVAEPNQIELQTILSSVKHITKKIADEEMNCAFITMQNFGKEFDAMLGAVQQIMSKTIQQKQQAEKSLIIAERVVTDTYTSLIECESKISKSDQERTELLRKKRESLLEHESCRWQFVSYTRTLQACNEALEHITKQAKYENDLFCDSKRTLAEWWWKNTNLVSFFQCFC
eukprot:c10058_g1_i2.p1 GENE.c10058_g1_i2~~c10058_g1_i2.p1  ORF type:complete len:244 (+),score=37.91 c10058_g1_i2:354-1085(+)